MEGVGYVPVCCLHTTEFNLGRLGALSLIQPPLVDRSFLPGKEGDGWPGPFTIGIGGNSSCQHAQNEGWNEARLQVGKGAVQLLLILVHPVDDPLNLSLRR